MQLAAVQFHCNFLLFHCLKSFCRCFSSAFQALLFIEFNFVLNSLAVNSCLIVDQRKVLLSSWPYLIWQIFTLKGKPFAFFIHCFHRYFYQTKLDKQWRQIDIQFIPWSRMYCILLAWWCFWMHWWFLYSVVPVARSAVPFTLKAAEINPYSANVENMVS